MTREEAKRGAKEQRKIEETEKAEGAVCKDQDLVKKDELNRNEEVQNIVTEGKVHTVGSEDGLDLPFPVLNETDSDKIKCSKQ